MEVETEVKDQLKEEEEEVIDVDDDVEMDDEDTKQDTLKTETTTCIGMYRWKIQDCTSIGIWSTCIFINYS